MRGRNDSKPVLSESLIRCRIFAETAFGLKAVAASVLNASGYVSDQGEQALAQANVSFLGNDIALISTSVAEHTGISLVIPESPVLFAQRKVSMLIAIAAKDQQYLSVLKEFARWGTVEHLAEKLNDISSAELLKAASGEGWPEPKQLKLVREFVIYNANGLHARPGKVFVSTLKPFEAKVEVRNTAKSYDYVNGKSIMKLLSLGVTKGATIEVKALGADAAQALDALEKAIGEGLGE